MPEILEPNGFKLSYICDPVAVCHGLSSWRDGRVVEGAALEMLFRGNFNEGSNPSLSVLITRTLRFSLLSELFPADCAVASPHLAALIVRFLAT